MIDKSDEYCFNPYTQTKCPICNTDYSVQCIDNPDKEDIYNELWLCKMCNVIVDKTINC
jgi:hypothetical protein